MTEAGHAAVCLRRGLAMRVAPWLAAAGAAGKSCRRAWSALRALCGDDAYERYVARRRQQHEGAGELSRAQYFRAEVARKWGGVRRCC
jgi:uncharacterized short protein YbdD (DUF466 family)